MKLKNITGALLTIALGSSLALFGREVDSVKPSTKPNGCHGPVLCPIFPVAGRADCCRTWHVDIGLLYQQPAFTEMVAGTSYVPAFPYDTTGGEFANQTITTLQECLDYSIGLTVSLGHLMKHDNWYFGGRFDWLSASVDTTYDTVDQVTTQIVANANLDAHIFINTDFDVDADHFNKAVYHAFMDIYVLDVLLSRGSYHSKSFSYEPYAGVKAMWFTAKQNVSYYNADIFDDGNVTKWSEAEHNWGAGPMFGFNGEYHFLDEIALFSDSDIAILYGEARNTRVTTLTGVADSDVETTRTITLNNNVLCQFYLPVRSIIGLKFSRYCLEDRHFIALKIGYDVRTVIAYPDDESGFTMGGLYTNLVWNF